MEKTYSTGNQIKTIRKNMALTQDAFAKKIGTSQNYVAQLEMGLKTPSVKLLKKISEESGWRMEEILEGRRDHKILPGNESKEQNFMEYKRMESKYSPDEVARALVFANTYLKMGR